MVVGPRPYKSTYEAATLNVQNFLGLIRKHKVFATRASLLSLHLTLLILHKEQNL